MNNKIILIKKIEEPKEETKIKIILLGVITAFGVACALSWLLNN